MLPLILLGLAAGAVGAGISKAIDGYNMSEEAEKIVKKIQRDARQKDRELKQMRDKVNDKLENYGLQKLSITSTTVKSFFNVFHALKKKHQGKDINIFSEIGYTKDFFNSSYRTMLDAEKVLGSFTKGSFAAYGVYGLSTALVTNLGAASTGAAISGLHGAAATNALLAWFGGGSLAAGGMGIAGGTLVLGGIVVAPLVAVMGFSYAANAEKELTNAYEYEKNIMQRIDEADITISNLSSISRRIDELSYALTELDKRASSVVNYLDRIIDDFDGNNLQHRAKFEEACMLVKNMMDLCNTLLLDEKNNLTRDSYSIIEKVKKVINTKSL